MLKIANRLLVRLGLAGEKRVITDEDRRKIRVMLESGTSPECVSQAFGYSIAEIREAMKADFLTGKLPSGS
jgi:hypothetical protein